MQVNEWAKRLQEEDSKRKNKIYNSSNEEEKNTTYWCIFHNTTRTWQATSKLREYPKSVTMIFMHDEIDVCNADWNQPIKFTNVMVWINLCNSKIVL